MCQHRAHPEQVHYPGISCGPGLWAARVPAFAPPPTGVSTQVLVGLGIAYATYKFGSTIDYDQKMMIVIKMDAHWAYLSAWIFGVLPTRKALSRQHQHGPCPYPVPPRWPGTIRTADSTTEFVPLLTVTWLPAQDT